MNFRYPCSYASRASSTAWPGPVEARTSIFSPFARRPARAGPASLAERPPPAVGLTIAKKFCFNEILYSQTKCPRPILLQGQNSSGTVELRELLSKRVSFYLQRGGARKILVVKNYAVNALVIQELAVARGNISAKLFRVSLAGLEMERKQQLLADHRALRPDIVGGKDAEFLDGKTIEDRLDILRINVFAFLGDDHVFLTAEELQVAGGIKTAEIAGHQPPVYDGLGGKLRFVEVAGHDCFAANGHLANAVVCRMDDTHLHPGKRLTHSVSSEGMKVVDGDGNNGLGKAVAVGDRDPEIVEELQRLRLGEGTSNDDGTQFATESMVNFLEQE